MTKQFKNLVSSSGECHQVNPLTGLASNMSGAVEKMRMMSNQSISGAQSSFVNSAAAPSLDVAEFQKSRDSGRQSAPQTQFSQWADEFGVRGPELIHNMPGRPLMPGPMYYPGQFGFSAHVPQTSIAPTPLQSQSASPGESVNDDLAAAKRMVEILRGSGNPKFANSTFVDFIDQVATGDLKLSNGQVVDRAGQPVDWDEVYGQEGGLGDLFEGVGDDAENLPDQMERIWNELRQDNSWLNSTPSEYQFQHASNEYIESENPLEIALKLIAQGRDAEAIIALEAEVRLNENSSEGWRLLGQLHAQFDRDLEAIKCLEKGHACDPFNLDSILALGVSLTNELDSVRAMETLRSWISGNEKYHDLPSLLPPQDQAMPDYDFTRLKKQVMELFASAAARDPADADVAIALGVLHNISRDYGAAIGSFVRAAELRPTDATVWNKLGATLANAGLSKEAISVYHAALSLKPNYARVWSNLAIAHTNIDQFDNASRFFLTAIQLAPNATHLWSNLVVALSNWQPENVALSDLLESRDVAGLISTVSGTPTVDSLPPPRPLPLNEVERLLQAVKLT